MTTIPPFLSAPPLVGRAEQLVTLRSELDRVRDGSGGVIFLTGEPGVGKSRLVGIAADDALRRGWTVAVGRGYPVETGVPYALFSDAMLPVLRSLDESTLSVLTRGREAELAALFPPLTLAEAFRTERIGRPADATKATLFWNFAQFIERLSKRAPILFVFEDLHWVDASSLELLHFLARQLQDERVLILGTFNRSDLAGNDVLRTTRRSLASLDLARVIELEPLSESETDELVRETFNVDAAVSAGFSRTLFEWTRGNPFFITESLRSLVEQGQLYGRNGSWLGWEIDELRPPSTVRDVIGAQVDRLSPNARAVAELAAALGTRVSHVAIEAVSGFDSAGLAEALDELGRRCILDEAETDAGDVVYDFCHPVVRETLYSGLGRARARSLHRRIAQALETSYGDRRSEHVDELAFHFVRANARELAPKAVRYLTAAGRNALARRGDREGADYLSAAVEYIERGDAPAQDAALTSLLEQLGRARQRLGEYDGAIPLWERARADAEQAADSRRIAALEWRIGSAHYWSGRPEAALERYDAALRASRGGDADTITVRARAAKGSCLLELGRHTEAEAELRAALESAERHGGPALLARAHRSSLLLHAWTGPPDQARRHGRRAVELAQVANEPGLACTAHRALAIVAAFTGRSADVAAHIEQAQRLANDLGSPILRLAIDEIAIEYLHASGDWDAALARAEHSIALARTLNQRLLLPRLLVWAAFLYIARGDTERGRSYVDEAWQRAGATDIHSVVPAHTGLAAYHLALGRYEEAIQTGQAGLEIVDRTGYVAWAVHRLLPTIVEAHLRSGQLQGAARYGKRLRNDSERLDHKLGLAWADAADACVAWLSGDLERGVGRLRSAVDALEAIPHVHDAVRLRRQFARRLIDLGDNDAAATELRHVHAVFARLGARPELEKTRGMLREIGIRPPQRATGSGALGLTAREVEIVHLVLERRSDKAIGSALDISPRTVSKHLSNIYKKVGVASRGELADFARTSELPT